MIRMLDESKPNLSTVRASAVGLRRARCPRALIDLKLGRPRAALPGVFQNDSAAPFWGDSPLFDFIQRPEAAQADEVIVQAAIANTGGPSGRLDIAHCARLA
jgi:hypothetical protein